jgi:hypothetical protein
MPLIFNPNYVNNFPQQAQAAFARALTTWSQALDSTVAIEVTAIWGVFMPVGLTAMCVPNPVANFQNAPVTNTWYPSALADKLAAQDVQPNEPDMTVFFNNNINWYTGQGNPQNNQFDLESIALHEVCHGLGFVSTFWQAGGWPYVGSYGDNALVNQVNLVVQGTAQQLGFQLPNLNSQPSVYGLHIQDLSGAHLTNPGRYNNNSNQLGAPLVSNNLFFDLNRYQVYAPNPFVPFTSIDHLHAPNSLMRPSIGPGQHVRAIDAPVLNILHELGW